MTVSSQLPLQIDTRCSKCGSPLKGKMVKLEQGAHDYRLNRPTWKATYRCRCGRRGRREW
jgi:hypothetical protein